MAVAFDAKCSAIVKTATALLTVSNSNLTIGAISNGAVIVMGWTDALAPGAMTATWNGVNSPQIGTISCTAGFGTVALFGLVGPASGNHALVFNATNAGQMWVAGISFSGVDQTGGATSFAHFNSARGTSAAPSVAITSATGNFTLSNFVTDAAGSINSINQTAGWTTGAGIDNSGSNTDVAGQYAAGAASVTHSGVISVATGHWAICGVDIVAAGGAAFTFFPQTQPDMAWLLRKPDMVGY